MSEAGDSLRAAAERVLNAKHPHCNHDDDILAIARAYLAATSWRPIADAPRDGTRVLLCGEWPTLPEFMRSPGIVIGHWAERWWSGGVPYEPTHWMSMPEPPALEGVKAP